MDTFLTWDPRDYLLGNYIQAQVNNLFFNRFNVTPFGAILDIGCGDGHYIHSIANTFQQCEILGIDSSPIMIQHAQKHWQRENLSFALHSIEDYKQSLTYDCILSFWCLHWTRLYLSLPNIYSSLKINGKFYAVISSIIGNSFLFVWEALKTSRYSDLAARELNVFERCVRFSPLVCFHMNKLPFKKCQIEMETIKIHLPNLHYFRGLCHTLPFMKKIAPKVQDDLSQLLCETFQKICEQRYGGELYYETRPIFIEATK